MQISILSGVYTNMQSQFRVAYPRNMVPVGQGNGISAGYLRTAQGLESFSNGFGVDRGGILWNGVCYRVSGSKLISVDQFGNSAVLGDVGPGGQCALDYSFDRLIINSGIDLYYYQPTGLVKVTDPDLGTVLDAIWIDGYTMTTDGTSLIVTELNDPLQVNPLQYGSSEIDPDPITGLIELRNEVYAMNRYTIEVFDNIGGNAFPFQRIEGANIPKGCVGARAKAIYSEAVAFLGGGRNEPCGVYVGLSGQTNKLSTREVDQIIGQYSEVQLAEAILEVRNADNQNLLYVHLPDQTLVYDDSTSKILGQPIWFSLHSSIDASGQYRAKNFVYAYGKWMCGDKWGSNIGVLTDLPTQYGNIVGWQFETEFLYNESRGAIIHSLELVSLTGRAPFGDNPQIFHSWTNDGIQWSDEKAVSIGQRGNFAQRVVWRMLGVFRNFRGLRFRGANASQVAFARLQAEVEPLSA